MHSGNWKSDPFEIVNMVAHFVFDLGDNGPISLDCVAEKYEFCYKCSGPPAVTFSNNPAKGNIGGSVGIGDFNLNLLTGNLLFSNGKLIVPGRKTFEDIYDVAREYHRFIGERLGYKEVTFVLDKIVNNVAQNQWKYEIDLYELVGMGIGSHRPPAVEYYPNLFSDSPKLHVKFSKNGRVVVMGAIKYEHLKPTFDHVTPILVDVSIRRIDKSTVDRKPLIKLKKRK